MGGVSGGSLATYRDVLRLPGLAALVGVGFLGRLPVTATGVVLTLHVAVGLHRGFAAAGLVGGAVTAGMAIGAAPLGRLIDVVGMRPVLLGCTVAEVAFWGVAPSLDVPALAVAAAVVGLLTPPVFPIVRQSLASSVPEPQQRPAFALDAMSVELSYVLGPALGTAAVLTLPPTTALWLVGAGFVLGVAGLAGLDPPLRETAPRPRADAVPGRWWLHGPMLAALAATASAILVLTMTELSVVAMLTDRGQTGWWPLANTVWCGASLLGGWFYGAAARPRSTAVLLGWLAVGSLPVALGGPWWVLSLLLIPAGACCAPALAASAEAVGRLAPDGARGVATGLHGSALMAGATVASPLAGLLIDTVAPAAAVAAAVLVTTAVAVTSAVVVRPSRDARASSPGRTAR